MDIKVNKSTTVSKTIDLSELDVQTAVMEYIERHLDTGEKDLTVDDIEICCRQEFCEGALVRWVAVTNE